MAGKKTQYKEANILDNALQTILRLGEGYTTNQPVLNLSSVDTLQNATADMETSIVLSYGFKLDLMSPREYASNVVKDATFALRYPGVFVKRIWVGGKCINMPLQWADEKKAAASDVINKFAYNYMSRRSRIR